MANRGGRAEIEIPRRKRALAPLFAYMERYHYNSRAIMRQAYATACQRMPNTNYTWQMREGRMNAPWWFVRGCCDALGRSVEEVMGPAWIAEFGVEYGLSHRQADVEQMADRLAATA